MRRLTRVLSVLAVVALAATAPITGGSSGATAIMPPRLGSPVPRMFAPAAPSNLESASVSTAGAMKVAASTTRFTTARNLAASQTVGENPIGRVSNANGFAGYAFGSGPTTDLQAFFTIPNPTPTNPPDSGWPGTAGSGASIALVVGRFTINLQVATTAGSEIDSDPVFSTLDACSPLCPGYYPGFHAGDDMEAYLDAGPDGSTGGFMDLTNGNSKTWSSGPAGSSPQVLIGEEDYCGYLLVQPCANVAGSAQVSGPPPNYLDYGAISFGNVTVNGEALGSALGDAGFPWWQQDNEVWGNVYDAETQNIGDGSSFLVTASNEAVPYASLTAGPPPDVDRPLNGANASIPFDVHLSFGSTETIYLDYWTSDGGSGPQGQPATAGQDYQSETGTLTFPPGTQDEQIPVPVLAGANQGGDRLFTFTIANPSFAVISSGSATGTIHEGPVVYGVVNSPVPLDGGGAVETVTGADFGQPGIADVVSICDLPGSGSTACVRAGGVHVASDTSLTFTAPDATTLQPANGGLFPVDTIVTNTKGVPSPVSTPDQIDYGCNTGNQAIGNYTVTGCLTPETYDDADVTDGNSTIDGGIQVSASKADPVDYMTGSGGAAVSSKGTSTVSLDVAGQLFSIFKGQLAQAMQNPVNFAIPSGLKMFGMKLSGQLTITPVDSGSAMGSVSVTLPGIIAAQSSSGASTSGATGTLTFTTAAGSAGGTGGISNLQVSVPQADFLNMFQLSNVNLTFQAPGTWNLQATVTGGDGQSSDLTGSLVYDGNTLTSASIAISQVSLAGLAQMSNFQLNYTSGSGWSGSGTITDESDAGTESATIAVTVNSSLLVSAASIDASNVTLFGVLNLKTFSLKYVSGKWSVALSTTIGGTATSASLSEQNGVIQSGSITIGKVQFLAGLTINSASLSYAASTTTTPSGCTAGPGGGSVSGSDVWCGSISVTLPGATKTITGFADFVGGGFTAGGFNVSGLNVPLLEGVFLNSLGAGVNLPSGSAGLSVQGSAGVTFGPSFNGASLLGATGSLTVTFAGSGGTGGGYTVTIDQLTGPGSLVLGSGTLSLPDGGPAHLTAQLGGSGGSGISLGGGAVTITGNISGSFTTTSFNLSGTGMAQIGSASLSVSYEMNSKGIAGCTLIGGVVTNLSAGFRYQWGGTISTYVTPTSQSHCSLSGF